MFYVTSDQVVGLVLRRLRLGTGLSQTAICQELDCTNSQYSRYETGISYLSLPTLRKICKIHKVSCSHVLSEVEMTSETLHSKGVQVIEGDSTPPSLKLEGKPLRAVLGHQ